MTFRRAALALLACLAVAPPASAADCPPETIEVVGRVVDPASGAPVPCCDVEVTVNQSGTDWVASGRTRADGSFDVCAPCLSTLGPDITITVVSACCGGTSTPVSVDGCTDPLTGLPRVVDVGDVQCTDAPVTGFISMTGNVSCRNAPFLDPVGDCSIYILDELGRSSYQTWTDAQGNWEQCASCEPGMGFWFGSVTAQCCGLSDSRDILGCPLSFEWDQFVCDPCPMPPCPAPQDVEISGLVSCLAEPAAPPVPLPDCDVEIIVIPGCSPVPETHVVRTDATGRYVLCRPCPSTGDCPYFTVQARSLCCTADTDPQYFVGCPPRLDMPDVVCLAEPGTSCFAGGPCGPGETLVQGIVHCDIDADGDGVLDPIPGCPVTIQPDCPGGAPPITVVTDANGFYSACVQCGGCASITATAGCCGASSTTGGTLDCSLTQVLDITCTTCVAPPCSPLETLVQGIVRCDVDADGDTLLDPVPDCDVRIQPDCPGGAPPMTVRTDANGFYSACVTCAGCQSITATAECCGASTRQGPPLDCAATQVLDINCTGCGLPPNPCAPTGLEIHGIVTCSRIGSTEPLAGCVVEMRCLGSPDPPITATTTADGSYSACFPCPTCPSIVVTATCCGATRTISPTTCYREQVDFDCDACAPPRPCPGPPDGVEVRGFVTCAGPGRPTALAGCEVELVASDGATLMPPVTAVTTGDGSYVACVPCPAAGLASIEARSTCCSGSSITPFAGDCPERATLADVACSDCTPCPPGMTRVEGRVHCRAGGGVAGCPVVIAVQTCTGLRLFPTITDAEGRYRACVPCACARDGFIRATAGCCDATRVVEPGRCGPVTPIPTLFCAAPCR